jgi:hypothetical protein
MTMKHLKVLMIASAFILFNLFLLAEENHSDSMTVTVTGEAAGTGLAAKEKSKENALRAAVEKGYGVYIDSATLSENAQLISDDVVAETRGFVQYYEVLERKEVDGIYMTKIRAEVSLEKIWQSQSLQLLLKRMGAPRFVVIASEHHEGRPAATSFALQKVTELLVDRGFLLVNAANAKNLSRQRIQHALSDNRVAAEIGKNANAEIIVMVDSTGTFARKGKAYGRQFDLFRGTCDIKAVQVDSRKIVAAAVKARQSGSVKDAIMAAAEENAGDIVKQLLEAWSKYLNMGRTIELVIMNVSVSELTRIIEELSVLEGVSSVQQRNFSGKRALLEIKSKHKALYLAESIENMKEFKLQISSFSADKITANKNL